MAKSHYIIPIFVPHAGCPHQCVFCNQRQISGTQRVPTGVEVEHKIEEYLATMGPHQGKTIEVAFFGGSFTAIPIRLQRELVQATGRFLEDGRVDFLRLSTRPDCLDEDNLKWLYLNGVRIVELGVQSMKDHILEQSKRGHNSQQVLLGAELVRRLGFQLGLQMMTGLPGDTPATALETGRLLAELQPNFVRIYPVLVIRDTELAALYGEGLYQPWDLLTTIHVCRDLLKLFTARHITVSRIGLQGSDNISLEGDILAGPWHPALRELVEADWARERVEEALYCAGFRPDSSRAEPADRVTLHVPPQDLSITRGQHNSNMCYFRNHWGLKKLQIKTDSSLPRRTICLNGECSNLNS